MRQHKNHISYFKSSLHFEAYSQSLVLYKILALIAFERQQEFLKRKINARGSRKIVIQETPKDSIETRKEKQLFSW